MQQWGWCSSRPPNRVFSTGLRLLPAPSPDHALHASTCMHPTALNWPQVVGLGGQAPACALVHAPLSVLPVAFPADRFEQVRGPGRCSGTPTGSSKPLHAASDCTVPDAIGSGCTGWRQATGTARGCLQQQYQAALKHLRSHAASQCNQAADETLGHVTIWKLPHQRLLRWLPLHPGRYAG